MPPSRVLGGRAGCGACGVMGVLLLILCGARVWLRGVLRVVTVGCPPLLLLLLVAVVVIVGLMKPSMMV